MALAESARLESVLPRGGLVTLAGDDASDLAVAIVAMWMRNEPFLPVSVPAASDSDSAVVDVRGGLVDVRVDSGFEMPRDAAVFLTTSGSTSAGRVVAHSLGNLFAGLDLSLAVQSPVAIADRPSEPDRFTRHRLGLTILPTMSLATMAGYTVLQRTLLVGETLALPKDLSPAGLLAFIDTSHPTSLSLTPYHARGLLRELRMHEDAKSRLASLAAIGIGGAVVQPNLAEELERLTGTLVLAGYGANELGGPAVMSMATDPPEARWTTVGRPLPGVQVRIAGADQNSSQVGELEVLTPALALGYFDRGEAGQRFARGWWRTGDSAEYTPSGNIRIRGRLSQEISRGGKRIDPTDIERRLLEHPSVADAVVVPLASRVQGEQDVGVVAVVRGEEPSLAELRRWVTATLPLSMRPRRVVFADEIPRTPDGKVRWLDAASRFDDIL